MITQVQFGNIFTSGSKQVLGGTNTGYDTEAIIGGLVDAKRLPAVQLEQKLEQNAAQQAAYAELRSILSRFQDASDFLRNPPGVQNDGDNIFQYRSAALTTNTAVAASNYLDVTVEPGASLSNYDISVNQIATQNTKTTNTFAATDLNAVVVGAGQPIAAGTQAFGAAGVNVTFDAGDTLAEVIAKVNAVSDQSGVEATALKVADGQYRIQFKTTDTGTAANYDLGYGYTEPSFFSTDAIFRFDAGDIDGDGDQADNPLATTPIGTAGDLTGNTSLSASGANVTLEPSGEFGLPEVDFAGVGSALVVGNTADINTGGPFTEKTFALSFTTGADVTGTQTIYEQGVTGRNFGVYIAPDPGNGGAATLFAVAHNSNEWVGADQTKVLNLGAVNANQHYNVEISFDASANPTAHDPLNTFTGYVNGVQVDQATNLQQQLAHTGDIAIGGRINGSTLPDGTSPAGDGNYFQGSVNEVVLTNTALSSAERTELNTYFTQRYQTPIPSVFDSLGFAIQEDAVDAELVIDGTTVVRSSNTIDDLIEDVTFELKQPTPPGTEVDVDVNPDLEIARNGILNFVDTYNELRIFMSRQTQIGDDGLPTDDAVLSSSSTLRNTMTTLTAELSRAVAGLGGISRLSDIGITFDDFPGDEETPFTRNILTVDQDTLDSALASDFDSVRQIFEFDYTSDDSDIQVFSRTNALNVSEFSLNIDITNGVYQATYDDNGTPTTIDLDIEMISGGGMLLIGQEGTVLEGLQLIYGDTVDTTANITVTQGIGDRIFNSLDSVLDEDSGAVSVEMDSLSDASVRLEEEIARIDEIVERFRQQMLEKFTALEQALSSVNTILQSLDAQANAQASA